MEKKMNTVCDLPGLGLAVKPDQVPLPDFDAPVSEDRGEAVLAGGCFWCTEAVFRRLKGVQSVQPGYAGGNNDTANYKAVCSGSTSHAEVIRIQYRPEEISYGQLLQVFFAVAHDATQLNRQGNDVGTQYRSAIFPIDEKQKEIAVGYIKQLTEAKIFASSIATTIEPLDVFFVAENYHHNYAEQNPGQSYIQFVSMPKVEKLEHYFESKLKS
jgi:peptide-methionine (S)-S-oxide reductase